MRALIAVAVTAAALLAGCSSDDGERATPPRSTTTSEAPPTSPPKVAPISAFAQVVSEYRDNLVQLAADTEADCAASDTAQVCQDAYRMFDTIVSQFQMAMLDVHSPSSSTYLGAPPDNIRALVEDTEELASKASRMASAYSLATCPDPVTSCVQEKVFAQAAAAELVQKLQAWDPHI